MGDRRTVSIPDATVLDSVVFNHTDNDQRRSDAAFSVAYGEDIGRAEDITAEAVAALDAAHSEPAPVVFIDALGDDGVDLKMRFYHDDVDRIRARGRVAEAIITTPHEAGVDAPIPEFPVQHP